MATVDELKLALVEADRKGDKRAAQLIAEKIKGMATPSAGEDKVGTLEAGLTIGSSILAEPISGLAGLAQSLNPFAEEGAASQAVQSTREAFTYQPKTQAGQEALGTVAETLAPVGEAFESTEQFLGDAGFELGDALGLDDDGKAVLATVLHSAPTAALELLGVAGGKGLLKTEKGQKMAEQANNAIQQSKKKAVDVIKRPSKNKEQIAQILEENPADIRGFGYEVLRPKPKETPEFSGTVNPDDAGFFDAKEQLQSINDVGRVKIKKSKRALEAEKQGLERQTTQFILGASKKDKAKMKKILEDVKTLRRDKSKAETIRATNTVGESLAERVNYVYDINQKAGKAVSDEVKKLKGQKVDISGAQNNLVNRLADDLNVELVDGKPRYMDSLVEFNPNDKKLINEILDIVNRRATDSDAEKVHNLKKIIDDNVTFGKQKEGGISSKVERVLKELRKDINDTMGETFPEYGTQNKIYSDTIGALDELQSIGGKRLDLTGDPESVNQALGRLSRRLASNAVSSVPLKDSINAIEAIARKYGGDFDDSIFAQLTFAEDMNNMFRTAPQASLKGELQSTAQQTAQMVTNPEAAAIGYIDKGINKMRGINEDNAFKAIEALLED